MLAQEVELAMVLILAVVQQDTKEQIAPILYALVEDQTLSELVVVMVLVLVLINVCAIHSTPVRIVQ